MTYFADKIIENKILKRTGIVDIGSNTIRLVVFEGPSRSPRYFYNEKVNGFKTFLYFRTTNFR